MTSSSVGHIPAPLETVIITDELERRTARPPDHAAENRAMAALMRELSDPDKNVLQDLVDVTLVLCNAHSAGISILEGNLFHWHAVAGKWSGFLGGTMPREGSPCGTVLDRNSTLLLSHPERHYPIPPDASPPIVEVLLAPFHVGDEAVGTIWIIAHDDSRWFDREDERLLMSLGRFASMTLQVQTANKLKAHAVDQLMEADRRKNEFLATLAHELRNPLAPIRNALEILKLTRSDEKALESASEMMERQVNQLARLVDDLLDVSRISWGKIELRREHVDLASIVNQAAESVQTLCDNKEQHLLVRLPPQPVYVYADPFRLAQVVGNLLHNACKFTDKGGRIVVSAEQESEYAAIRVRDTGIGIAAGQLGRIFDMFIQADTSLERSASGLGIGLTLARNLLEMHGGTVEVQSDGVGHGSEFVVRLPLVTETQVRPRALEGSSKPIPVVTRRILVVDDNRDSANSLAALLELTGNDAHIAYDGIEAVQAATTLRPDLILLDIGLPKLNGYDAARQIRQQPWGNNIMLVALTGWGQEEDRQRSKQAGFDHHLVKPVDPAALTKLLVSLPTGRNSDKSSDDKNNDV